MFITIKKLLPSLHQHSINIDNVKHDHNIHKVKQFNFALLNGTIVTKYFDIRRKMN